MRKAFAILFLLVVIQLTATPLYAHALIPAEITDVFEWVGEFVRSFIIYLFDNKADPNGPVQIGDADDYGGG